MTREYWDRVGGLLIEEAEIVPRGPGRGRRFVDALILPNREKAVVDRSMVDPRLIRNEEVIVVQTKRSRLGAYLAGQAVFSPRLVEQWLPVRRAHSVALCSAGNSEIDPLVEARGVEVVALEGYPAPAEGKSPVRELRERFWQSVGGTLVERFLIHRGEDGFAYRAEAIVLPDGETRKAGPGEPVTLEDRRVIAVQTNPGLGMYVAGQALITRLLIEKYHQPASLESVAVVPRDDVVIRSFFGEDPQLRRWVAPERAEPGASVLMT